MAVARKMTNADIDRIVDDLRKRLRRALRKDQSFSVFADTHGTVDESATFSKHRKYTPDPVRYTLTVEIDR